MTGQTQCRLDCTRCGDGVIQANNTETCDDGNTVSGCRVDQPQRPLDDCLNTCTRAICDDPARITFKEPNDLFKFHGRLITDTSVDFINDHFVIELRTPNGDVIFRTSQMQGTIASNHPGSFKYKNRDAKLTGGLFQLKAKSRLGYYKLTLKAYGQMDGAVADMVTRVYIGSNQWAVRGVWEQVGTKGWRLGKSAVFLPVP